MAVKEVSQFCATHITPYEVSLMQRLFTLRERPLLTLVSIAATRLGDGPLWGVAGAVFLACGNGRTRMAVFIAAVAISLSVLLFTLVKKSLQRPRPYESWPQLSCLLTAPDKFSFPSGHTMTAFAATTVFAQLIPGAGLFFLPIASLIGFSRVFLGLHYPTDVLVGALVGSGIAFGLVRLAAFFALI